MSADNALFFMLLDSCAIISNGLWQQTIRIEWQGLIVAKTKLNKKN